MATTLKVLWQSFPTSAIDDDLYTVPASTSTVVSSYSISNTSSIPDVVRLMVSVAWAVTNLKQSIHYDFPLQWNDTLAWTLWMSLSATDVVRVYSQNWTSAFNLFWQENT